ncbi:MAG: glutaredoxin family protein [Rhodocyclaceae bacterium]
MNTAHRSTTLTVMSREWCHLCHDLIDRLRPLASELGWEVEVVDVDRHPKLEARWDELVPVVLAGDVELCHYHLDEAAVRAYCGRFPLESAP